MAVHQLPQAALLVVVIVGQGVLASDVNTQFVFPSTGVKSSGKAVLLAIDDVSLPLKRNLCYYLSKPSVRREPVLTPSREHRDAPDYLAAHFYGTVLRDQGKFRMWYYPCHLGPNPDWSPELKRQAERWKDPVIPGPLCYAESADGLAWTKPNLGQLMFKGNRANNALDLPSALTGDACVIRDDGDPDPNRRYKLAFWTQYDPWDFPTMRIAVSPDGLVWKTAPKPPIRAFLEHASFYRHNGLYIANSQTMLPGESGRERGRQGSAWVSTNFDTWLQESAESFALPYSENPKRDEVHLGVGAASFGNVAVGLYCIWHNDPEFGKISGDLGLVVSNDGIAFREPVKGHRWMTTAESPVTPVPGKQYPTVLCQANGIVNVGDETRIYHGRWRNVSWSKPDKTVEDYYAEVAMATLPRDRWGALGLAPQQSEGCVWSTPITLPRDRCEVRINAQGVEGLGVELADERFHLLPAYSGMHRGTVQGPDGLACAVQWPNRSLAEVRGQTVRLRIHLRKTSRAEPRLFAVYLDAAPGPAIIAGHQQPKPGASPVSGDLPPGELQLKLSDFPFQAGDRKLVGLLAEPGDGRLASEPAMLLTFSSTRRESLTSPIYDEPAKEFVAAGHRALSFDLPEHGDRVTPGRPSGLDGMRQAILAGEDPFERFVADGRAAVDACLSRGLVRRGRIYACGVSRAGYCVLRLAAADPRIAGVAGLAPVTDWRVLREFAQVGSRHDLAPLSLENFAAPLVGRPVYLAIGNHDGRVGTDCCTRFAARLFEEESRQGLGRSRVLFHVVDDSEGHTLDPRWRRAGAEFLLRLAQ